MIGLLLVSLYGIGVVASKSFIPKIEGFGTGELFAFLSVLTAGFWSVSRKKLSNYLNNKEITMIVMFIAFISGALIAFMKGENLNLSSFGIQAVLFGVILGAILNVSSTFFENFGFENLNVILGNQILMLSTVFALINGLVFYQEMINLPEFIGGILIFSSVWMGNKLLS